MSARKAAARKGPELIVAANRGPVSFHADTSGEPVVTRGAGGLVTVLTTMLRYHDGVWVAMALSPEEKELAAKGKSVSVDLDGEHYRVRYVTTDKRSYDRYYNIVANPMLWFIQHYLWDLGRHPDITQNEIDAWTKGYVPVNELFAKAIVDELDGDGDGKIVIMHDYHLYATAPRVRAAAPRAFLQQFVHIPWAQSDYWRVLPRALRDDIFNGLLANDIVSFHTQHYVENFLHGCLDLLDADVDEKHKTVTVGERIVWVRAYPVSIDAEMLYDAVRSQRVAREERKLLQRRRRYLVVRVDRMDLSKNILRGFKAFDRFLDLYPQFKELVTFVALLQPSREDVEEYAEYRRRVMQVVAEINTKHGNTDWMPIDVRIQDNFPATLAAYKHFDALMVNATYDGMNLVAKEGALLNEHDGVLILSENTGAFEELGAFAVPVNPFDIEEQAEALHVALTMPAEERHARLESIRGVVEGNSIDKWIGAQFADFDRKRAKEKK